MTVSRSVYHEVQQCSDGYIGLTCPKAVSFQCNSVICLFSLKLWKERQVLIADGDATVLHKVEQQKKKEHQSITPPGPQSAVLSRELYGVDTVEFTHYVIYDLLLVWMKVESGFLYFISLQLRYQQHQRCTKNLGI